MIGFLDALGEKGAKALRRTLLAATGAGFIILAAGFAGAALVDLLALAVPRYVALGGIAAVLLVGGLLFLAAAGDRKTADPAQPIAGRLAAASPGAAPDWRTALQLALVEEAQDRPARAAALAALAGLILGAMEEMHQGEGTDYR
jgi:hypothetical protein